MTPLKATAVFVVVAGLATFPSCRRTPPAQQETGEAAPAPAAANSAARDVDLEGMDRGVPPGNDFFKFANGTWLKKTEIPPDRSSYGVWSVLIEQAQQRTRDLLMAAAAGKSAAGSDERKIGDYYGTYLDEAAVESRGTAPLTEPLQKIAAIADRRALATWLGQGIRADVDPLNYTNFYTDHVFGLWVSQDLDDPAHYAPYLLQGGLGMPDRDYYIDPAPRMEKTRAAYRDHIATMLTLAGIAEPQAKADRILALEKRIAAAHTTRTVSADVLKGNNHWKRGEFDRRAPGMDWAAFFAGARLQDAPQFIVWQPGAVTGIAALVGSQPLDVWRDYLAFHAIDHHASVLPRAFAEERFAFYGKTLSGTPQMQDRWKRAVNATNDALPEAVGKAYVQRHFPADAKKEIQVMVSNLVAAFDRRIDHLGWMTPKTKAAAKAKLASLQVGIGFPDRWQDYAKLEVVRGDAYGNAWRAELFEYERRIARIGQPMDRSEWSIAPQTVNALNLPAQNALNFPAAILEPPFFDPSAGLAHNYGSLGAIIGHEISHSFDDTGSQFDASGRVVNWWTPEDLAHFKAASAKLVSQYEAYRPFADLHVNGQLTLGENIADVAGLSAAYDAYKMAAGTGTAPLVQGFTGDQQFFLSFAQSWRSKAREELARQLVVTDGHAPDEYRADTVRNLDAWYPAFDVRAGQRLFLAPDDRVRVW
jgi:predicted metalloendopeptidase